MFLSAVEEAWWTAQDGTGYLSPEILAPDPNQPRRTMRKDEFEELVESVGTRGVRETVTITPRCMAPWAPVAPEHEQAFFLIVSGHRRRNAASAAGVKAIPVKVKIYASEKEHRLDVSILNKNRGELSDLEEGMEMVALRSVGWKLEELGSAFGYKAPQIYNRINLTKLHPDIQRMLDPDEFGKNRLPGTVAGHIGGVNVPTPDELQELQERFEKEVRGVQAFQESFDGLSDDDLRFSLQKILLAVILARKLNSVRATSFIREHTLAMESHQGRAGRKVERFRPEKRRDIVTNFVNGVLGSVIMDWPPAEFRRAFELAPREELEELIKNLGEARDSVEGLIAILEKIRDTKRPTHPEAIRIQQARNSGG